MYGQCGNGTTDLVRNPFLVKVGYGIDSDQVGDCKIESGDVGDMHTVLLTKTNQVYHFGDISHSGYGSLRTRPILVSRDKMGISNSTYIERVITGYNTTVIVCLR